MTTGSAVTAGSGVTTGVAVSLGATAGDGVAVTVTSPPGLPARSGASDEKKIPVRERPPPIGRAASGMHELDSDFAKRPLQGSQLVCKDSSLSWGFTWGQIILQNAPFTSV